MGLVYAAELRPSKMDFVANWLPSQQWFTGDPSAPVSLGAFRFDDPAGEVGIETHLVGVGRNVYHVPLSYRGAPLAGAEAFLMGTMEHSVLGSRWVYDATGDPVYTGELAAALLAAKPQAVNFREAGGRMETLPHTAELFSTGTPDASLPDLDCGVPLTDAGVTSIPAGSLTLKVLRVLDGDATATVPGSTLAVTWAGQESPVLIAVAVQA